MSKSIIEWFNPLVPEHMAVYRHLCEKGHLPITGIPNDLEYPNNWQVILMSKMSVTLMRLFPKDATTGTVTSLLQTLIENSEAVMSESRKSAEYGDWPELNALIETTEGTIEQLKAIRETI